MDETRRLIERASESTAEARRVTAESRRLVETSREIQQWTARVQGRLAREAVKSFSFDRFSNSLLSLLPTAELERLVPMLHGVGFVPKQVLQPANTGIDYVYFPITGLLSSSLVMRDGAVIGVSTTGSEGLAGLPSLVGNHLSPFELSVQVAGHGLRMDVTALEAECARRGMLQDIITAYQSVCAVQNAYRIACNGLHHARQRCCCQLLSIQDRIGSDALPLTHETLALMLGVRRATVTEELASLQAEKAVDTRRGLITILDRPKLESVACECYGAIRQEFARLFRSRGVDGSRRPRLLGD